MSSFFSPKGSKLLYLTTAAALAALYVVFTLPFAQFAYGPLQFRLAEILVIMPVFTPAAIPGITLGCFLANLLNPNNLGVIDIVFGTLATLLAAVSTGWIATRIKEKPSLKKDVAALFPPVLFNALIVGSYLAFLLTDGPVTAVIVLISVSQLALSETILVYGLGLPLLFFIRKSKVEAFLFRRV